jgi:hypothetical protein
MARSRIHHSTGSIARVSRGGVWAVSHEISLHDICYY